MKGEVAIKDYMKDSKFQLVEPNLTLPTIARYFSERPRDALLVYDKKNEKFLGSFYLYDFNRVYADPPKKWLKNIHKATIGDVMNTNIESIDWSSSIAQVWGMVTIKKPHAIILKDERGRFAGYLSNTDLWKALDDVNRDKYQKTKSVGMKEGGTVTAVPVGSRTTVQ